MVVILFTRPPGNGLVVDDAAGAVVDASGVTVWSESNADFEAGFCSSSSSM